jgi:hypothetical protein
MSNIGSRIIFDQDGEVVIELAESPYATPRKAITSLDYIDLEFGEINYVRFKVIGVDLVTRKPILEEIVRDKTPQEQTIEDLENQLLLMADSTEGGIL